MSKDTIQIITNQLKMTLFKISLFLKYLKDKTIKKTQYKKFLLIDKVQFSEIRVFKTK